MALYVNTNVSAINGQRKLTNSTNALNVSYQRLASGLRINSAKDDAAGLQISDRLTSQINGLGQGNRNCNDGIAFAQTIEGAMDEMTNMLQRVRTLSIQAANGTYSTEDRKSIQQEITQLSTEITRIACKTTYAGKTVLDGFRVNAAGGGNSNTTIIGSDGKVTFQVGANANDHCRNRYVKKALCFQLSPQEQV
ncbi:A-type flagellin [Anaerobiospirillum thomasii]|uniref:A-type flagellin n=1 Tax=Anaerobiospirillum thomasii TaxID=179995 RepID=A0A2X0X769_9GAMM|nr:A-type flagellin [Anaerobiospirillum thomasii]